MRCWSAKADMQQFTRSCSPPYSKLLPYSLTTVCRAPRIKDLCNLKVEGSLTGCGEVVTMFEGLGSVCSPEQFICSDGCKAAIAAAGVDHVSACYTEMFNRADHNSQYLM